MRNLLLATALCGSIVSGCGTTNESTGSSSSETANAIETTMVETTMSVARNHGGEVCNLIQALDISSALDGLTPTGKGAADTRCWIPLNDGDEFDFRAIDYGSPEAARQGLVDWSEDQYPQADQSSRSAASVDVLLVGPSGGFVALAGGAKLSCHITGDGAIIREGSAKEDEQCLVAMHNYVSNR